MATQLSFIDLLTSAVSILTAQRQSTHISQQTLSQHNSGNSLLGHGELRYETVLRLLAAPSVPKIRKTCKAANTQVLDNMLKGKS